MKSVRDVQLKSALSSLTLIWKQTCSDPETSVILLVTVSASENITINPPNRWRSVFCPSNDRLIVPARTIKDEINSRNTPSPLTCSISSSDEEDRSMRHTAALMWWYLMCSFLSFSWNSCSSLELWGLCLNCVTDDIRFTCVYTHTADISLA